MNEDDMEKKNKKSLKHIILPFCITVYFVVIAYISRDEWLVEKNTLVYWGKILVEIIIIILLSVVLKKREKLRNKTENHNQ